MSNELPLREVVEGDCLEVMRNLPPNSIDLVATDPPYGLQFMGKDWDKVLPSVDIWRECLRVLKLGAFAFILCTPRLDSLIEQGRRLQEAGFVISFTPLFWAYSNGFPKAMSISKAVDKKLGVEPRRLGTKYSLLGQGSKPGTIGDKHEGYQRPWNADPNALAYFVTESVTPEAKRFNGAFAGFQPKPSCEVVIVAMKPLAKKTYVEQALDNGKGVTWLNEGKIPFSGKEDESTALDYFKSFKGRKYSVDEVYAYSGGKGIRQGYDTSRGRFPANLLVSDDVLDTGEVSKSRRTDSEGGFGVAKNTFGADNPDATVDYARGYDDEGQFSRYFSLDAWWAERIKRLPKNVQRTFPFLISPKASSGERNEGLKDADLPAKPVGEAVLQYHEGLRGADPPVKNFHPTVKPLALMSYLVMLGSREGDVILDPFLGSGTTAIACEITARKWIGIELNKEYAEIARGRLKTYLAASKMDEWL